MRLPGLGGEDDDPHIVIPSVGIVPQITEVRLYAETLEHAREHHGNDRGFGQIIAHLPSMSSAVQAAISNPTSVENPRVGSYVYVSEDTTNFSGDPLRVPVKHIAGTSGLVKTLYFASTDGARNTIWRRT
jgi:hypothetical protein